MVGVVLFFCGSVLHLLFLRVSKLANSCLTRTLILTPKKLNLRVSNRAPEVAAPLRGVATRTIILGGHRQAKAKQVPENKSRLYGILWKWYNARQTTIKQRVGYPGFSVLQNKLSLLFQ